MKKLEHILNKSVKMQFTASQKRRFKYALKIFIEEFVSLQGKGIKRLKYLKGL